MSSTIQREHDFKAVIYFGHSTENEATTQVSHGNAVVSPCTHGEVQILDGPLQVFESHRHCMLSVIQVAEVSHDDFCTLLQMPQARSVSVSLNDAKTHSPN